jgi:hypothetical protein
MKPKLVLMNVGAPDTDVRIRTRPTPKK